MDSVLVGGHGDFEQIEISRQAEAKSAYSHYPFDRLLPREAQGFRTSPHDKPIGGEAQSQPGSSEKKEERPQRKQDEETTHISPITFARRIPV